MNYEQAINNIISNPDWANTVCIVNRSIVPLETVEQMGWNEFALRTKLVMPLKFYKFFPNKTCIDDNQEVRNYSIEALKNNTVYLSSPSDFDDVYDSELDLDFETYERIRLEEICRRCSLVFDDTTSSGELKNKLLFHLRNSFMGTERFDTAFVKQESQLKCSSNELFAYRLMSAIQKGKKYDQALDDVIKVDYDTYVKSLRETFRVACFSTNPYSQLMWGGLYADCHRGFCLEYAIDPNDNRFQTIFCNMYPMIYCKTRPDMTEMFAKAQDEIPSEASVWNIYFHGALRKSVDWAFQDEWRLLLPLGMIKNGDYNVPFFPISKVLLGNRMGEDKRKEIIDICEKNHIPYRRMVKNKSVFEMQEAFQ